MTSPHPELSLPISSRKQPNEEVASRCETVLNTTMAEIETYHTQKVEDFASLAKEHLDGEIEFYEQVSVIYKEPINFSFSKPCLTFSMNPFSHSTSRPGHHFSCGGVFALPCTSHRDVTY